MRGPYHFTPEDIDYYVQRASCGVYVLYPSFECRAAYVGRSDSNVNRRLKEQYRDDFYDCRAFRFAYCRSPREAYYEECRLYHHYEKHHVILNERHPDRPDYTEYICPECRS